MPKPRPGVFRITKTNHNILQGVSKPQDRLTAEDCDQVKDWTEDNAKRYWLSSEGPLRPPSEGGAHVIVIDDPQMAALIPIAKEAAPDRPVIFRSHIHIRSDLIATPGTPQAEAWERLWESVQLADVFISHPVGSFVPKNIPPERIGFVPASTDWWVIHVFAFYFPWNNKPDRHQVGWTEQIHARLGHRLLRPEL